MIRYTIIMQINHCIANIVNRTLELTFCLTSNTFLVVLFLIATLL